MTKKIFNSFMILYFIFLILITIGNWNGYIRFGLGLGDLIYLVLIVFIFFISLIVYIRSLKRGSNIFTLGDKTFIVFCILFSIFLLLKITVFRGDESLWDGKVFFK